MWERVQYDVIFLEGGREENKAKSLTCLLIPAVEQVRRWCFVSFCVV